ncbi:MAG: hypothetical protein JSV80_16375 [Acidobacteriota bacterium]|nr:MAG: hypothetical protein JSV80_16375 [Acidobacteriota bacterium]
MRNGSMTSTALAITACITLASLGGLAAIPEPDHIFYGPAPEQAGTLSVSLGTDPMPVASFDIAVLGGSYVLRVPMDAVGLRTAGRARVGDEAVFFLDGVRLTTATVGERGSTQLIDLSAVSPAEGVRIDDLSVTEGDEGRSEAVFELTLARARAERVVVSYSVEAGTATAGEDFVMPAGTTRSPSRRLAQASTSATTVAFGAGETSAEIVVEIIGDRLAERPETFFVTLTDAGDVPLDRERATCTIIDDDSVPVPTLSIGDVRAREGGGAAGLTVTLSDEAPAEISVQYATVADDATAGDDFVATSGALTFWPGDRAKTIHVTILDDEEWEPNERFFIQLSQPSGALIAVEQAVVTILDDDGEATEPVVGRASLAGEPRRVPIDQPFREPIVILGPASDHSSVPVIAKLEAIADEGFSARLAAWRGDALAEEQVSYLVIERGRHDMPDGSIWEADTFAPYALSEWIPRHFLEPFPSAPELFLTIQTSPEARPVAVRVKNVRHTGFEAALFDGFGLRELRAGWTVGYLAIYSPFASGTIVTSDDAAPYVLQRPIVGAAATPVLSWKLRIDAPSQQAAGRERRAPDTSSRRMRQRSEQALRERMTSSLETMSVLGIGSQLFAQSIAGAMTGPMAVRAIAPEYRGPIEWGTAADISTDWKTIPLVKPLSQPVVIVKPVLTPGANACAMAISNVSDSGFDVRCQSWDGAACAGMRVSYLVAEQGAHTIGGLNLRAGTVQTSTGLSHGWQEVSYGASFEEVPAVLVSLQTDQDNTGTLARIHNRNASWFALSLQRRDGAVPVEETVGWIAIESGSGTTSDGRAVRASTQVLHQTTSTDGPSPRVRFLTDARVERGAVPVLLADTSSTFYPIASFVCHESFAPEGLNAVLMVEPESGSSAAVVEDASFFYAD